MSNQSTVHHSSEPSPEQKSAQKIGVDGVVAPGRLLQRAQIDPASLTPADIKHLQRSIGNRATGRLLAQQLSVQTKLQLGPANDKYEQEADDVARQVVRRMAAPPVQRSDELDEEVQAKPRYNTSAYTITPSSVQPVAIKRTFVAPKVQREDLDEELTQAKPLAAAISPIQRSERSFAGYAVAAPKVQREDRDEELAQASPSHGLEGGDVEASVAQTIQRAKGGGRELDPRTRSGMEGAFGAKFGGVRVHTDAQADTLNRSLNARAFTTGKDIFFRKGEYNPGSSGGKELLAHELTHTVQQGGASADLSLQRQLEAHLKTREVRILRSNFIQRAPGLPTKQTLRDKGFKPGKKLTKSTWEKLEENLDNYKDNVPSDNYQMRVGKLAEIEILLNTWLSEHLNKTGKAKKSKEQGKADYVVELLKLVQSESIRVGKIEKTKFTIKAAGDEIDQEDKNSEALYDHTTSFINGYEGDVWFNTIKEMVNWVKSGGKTEGIGVYKGKWVNYTGKGPIIWGEHHDAGKEDFIHKLNIEHFLVEGSHETSLHGHEVGDTGLSKTWTDSNQPYEGSAGGHAVENIWLKLAANVEHFWADLPEQLRGLTNSGRYGGSGITDIGRLGELYEGIKVIKAVKDTMGTTDDITANKIAELVKTAKESITNLEIAKWNDIELQLRAMGDKRGPFRELKNAKADFGTMATNVEILFKCIVGIATQQFGVLATESEILLDKEVNEKSESSVLEKWALRREVFQLKNIEAALEKDPKPLLTTIGLRHAENQKGKLESLLSRHKGKLIIAPTLGPLIEYGEKPI